VVKSKGIDAATGNENFITANGSTTNSWNAADKVNAGSTDPEWQGTLKSLVTAKGISLGVYLNYQLGVYSYNQTLADKVENANLEFNADKRVLQNRWSAANTGAIFKALSLNGLKTNPTFVTDRFVAKNNLFSLSSVTLGYTIPKFKSIPLTNTSFVLMAHNLIRSGNNDMEKGIYYPFAKSFVFKLTTSIR
jgi:hypothetical protein